MPAPEEFSCFPAVEEGGTEEFLDESDNADENYTEETSFENTPMICSITEARKNSPFATWQPFIPSNWQENSSQGSPAQLCWQSSSVQPCFSQEPSTKAGQHFTTNSSPQISSIEYSPPEETRVKAAVLASLLSQGSKPVVNYQYP